MDIDEKIFLDVITEHSELLDEFKKSEFFHICEIVHCVQACFDNNGKILLIGNGGSAADCQHIVGELMGRFNMDRIPLPAISLATDTSVLTCIGNDYNYESIFSRQVEALAADQDVLWALSTSGSSPSMVKAAQVAKSRELIVIAFTGKENTPLEQIYDICLCAGTEETARAQEIHQLGYHIICKYLDQIYGNNSTC